HLLNLDGTLRWKATGPGNVWSVAAVRLAKGVPCSVICAHSESSILVYDAAGRRTGEIGKGREVEAVYGADLHGDGVDEVFGLGTTESSGLTLWAYDAAGRELWHHRAAAGNAAFIRGPIAAGRFWP